MDIHEQLLHLDIAYATVVLGKYNISVILLQTFCIWKYKKPI